MVKIAIIETSIVHRAIIAAGLSSAVIVANTFALDLLKARKAKHGFFNALINKQSTGFVSENPQVSDDLQRLINEVLNDSKSLKDKQKKRIVFDTYLASKPWSAGSTKTRYGSRILLPDYLNVNTSSELRASKLNSLLSIEYRFKILDKKIWLSSNGLALIDSFVLSDKAKKYLIARELYSTDGYSFLYIFSVLTICTHFFLELIALMKRDKKISKIAQGRMPYFVILNLFIATLFLISFNPSIMGLLKLEADAKVFTHGAMSKDDLLRAENRNEAIDKNYLEGAIEYYNKIKHRNLALKAIIKESNASFFQRKFRFSASGDENHGILNPELSIKHRLEFINDISSDSSKKSFI